MTINRKTRREVIETLMPYLVPERRETLVSGAFWGDSLLERFSWEGDAATFTANLVNTLLMDGPLDDGADPLPVLLEEVQLHVPPGERAAVDALLARVTGATETADETPSLLLEPASKPLPEQEPLPIADEEEPSADAEPQPLDDHEGDKGETPSEPDRYDRAAERLAARDYDGALALYQEAIEAKDRPAEAYYQIGRVLEIQKDDEGALANYEMSLRHLPDARVHTRRGVIYALRKDRESAIQSFEEATTGPEPDAGGFLYRAMLYFDEGKYDRALADLTQALALDSSNARAFRERGVVYTVQGDYDAAEADFTEAIRLNPSDAQAYYYRGTARDESGATIEAIADYTRAIRANPNTGEFYFRRGKVRFTTGDYAAVIPDMEAAIALDPKNAEAHFTLALCEMQHNGAYAVAKSHLVRALEIAPDNKAYQDGLRIAEENL